jgi:hypothetical protein
MFSVSKIITLLPTGWQEKADELGIIQRRRELKSIEDLMLLALFHIVNGSTLIEVSEIARIGKIANISDVAFMKQFEKLEELFCWILEQIQPCQVTDFDIPEYLSDYRPLGVDASDVTEKGRSGRLYRLHYAIDIFRMVSSAYMITSQKIGEKLSNFNFSQNDLIVADRAYGTIGGISHCIEQNAEFILRLKTEPFAMYDDCENKIDLSSQIRDMKYEEEREFSVNIKLSGTVQKIRVCVKKKDEISCKNTIKRIKQQESRKQKKLSDVAHRMNEFIVVCTTLPDSISTHDVLQTYRLRWQVEIFFKRLKSIIGFGELPKKREKSSLAWLNGKLMVAVLIELFIAKSSFFPQPK